MKALSLLIMATLITIVAFADSVPLVMPTPQQVDILACSSPSVEYQLTGQTTSDGAIGIVFEQTKCAQHSGRGGGTTAFHSSCSYVTWNPDGTISSIEIISTTISRASSSLTNCLAQTGM